MAFRVRFYILSFLLLFANESLPMATESKYSKEMNHSLLMKLPNSVKKHIFKILIEPKNNLDVKEIIQAKKNYFILRLVCKNFNELLVEPKDNTLNDFTVHDDQLYGIKEVNELNKKDKQIDFNISNLESAVKHDVVPYVSFCLSKTNEPRHWLRILTIAHQYNRDFIQTFQLSDFSFYQKSLFEQKDIIKKKFKSAVHSKLIDWLEKNRIEEKICENSLGILGRRESKPMLLCELDDFVRALEILHK